MKLFEELKLSEYQDYGPLEKKENIHLVRNKVSGEICIKKILEPMQEEVLDFRKANGSPYFPKVFATAEEHGKTIVIEEYITGMNLEDYLMGLAGACAGGGDDERASDTKPQKVGETSKTEQSEEPQTETPAAEEVDNEFIQPKDGHIYYKMDFEFENISDSDQYVSSWDFNCYADGYDMEQSYVLDGLDLDATLSPGKKTKGSVVFEVPEDAESIVLEYETNFWTENKIVFVVK